MGTRGSVAAWAPGYVGAVLWGRTSVGSHANVPSSGSELNGTVRAPVRVRRVEDPAVGVGNRTGLTSEVSRVKAGLCSPCTCPSPPPPPRSREGGGGAGPTRARAWARPPVGTFPRVGRAASALEAWQRSTSPVQTLREDAGGQARMRALTQPGGLVVALLQSRPSLTQAAW